MPSKVRVRTPISSRASETGFEEKSPPATRSAALVRLTIGVTMAFASSMLSSAVITRPISSASAMIPKRTELSCRTVDLLSLM